MWSILIIPYKLWNFRIFSSFHTSSNINTNKNWTSHLYSYWMISYAAGLLLPFSCGAGLQNIWIILDFLCFHKTTVYIMLQLLYHTLTKRPHNISQHKKNCFFFQFCIRETTLKCNYKQYTLRLLTIFYLHYIAITN